MCEKLHPILTHKPFPIANVVYSLSAFSELLDSGNLKPGECIIFDEAAGSSDSGIVARSAMSRENKDFVSLITTIGERRLILFYVAPKQSQLDSLVRTVGVHGRFIMLNIDRKTKTSKAEFAWVHAEADNNFVGYPKPRIIEGGVEKKVKCVKFSFPSKELNESYREKKKLFLAHNVHKINLSQKIKSEKGDRKELTLKKVVDVASMDLERFVSVDKRGNRFVDADLLRVEYELPAYSAKAVAKSLMRQLDAPVKEKVNPYKNYLKQVV